VSLLLSGFDTRLDALPGWGGDLDSVAGPAYEDPVILAALSRRYGVSEAEVFPSLGTSLGIFLALAALIRPGEEVLVETPGYESLRRVPEALGADVRRFSRRAENQYGVDPEDVMRAWRPGVSVVVVTDLHNPTGRTAGDEALTRLAADLKARNAMLLVDEVYRDFRPGAPGTARALGDNVVVTSSLTKVYGLGNLRAGWILAPPDVVLRLRRMMDVLQSIDPTPAQALFRRSFEVLDGLREKALVRATAGWKVVETWARGEPRVRIVAPAGGIIAWVRLPEGISGSDVAGRLDQEHGVAVVPGRFFEDDGGIRLGFGGDPNQVAAGLDALSRVLGA
jgi:aspartate/methionine/tyrosine aminotransferase